MLEVSQGSFPRGGTTLGFIAESFWDFRSLASIKIRVRCSIFPGAFVLLPRFSQRKSGNNVKGLLSPALSSKGGEGEEPALAVRLSTGFRLLAAVGLGAQHEAQQSVDHARIAAGATHGDVRHNAHIALADNLHELHDGVPLRAECLDTDAICLGFCAPGSADGLSFTKSTQQLLQIVSATV